jgi:hypothetical protein
MGCETIPGETKQGIFCASREMIYGEQGIGGGINWVDVGPTRRGKKKNQIPLTATP